MKAMPNVRPTVRVFVETLNKHGEVGDYNNSRCGFLVEQHVKSVKHRKHLELKTKKQSLLSESLKNVTGSSYLKEITDALLSAGNPLNSLSNAKFSVLFQKLSWTAVGTAKTIDII